jgi:8-oxo-dGTP diphosphatase
MSSKPTLASAVPRIGVAVFILHPVPTTQATTPSQPTSSQQYKFILGQRLGSHGSNTWALPGGHLEFGESFEECAIRETLEETDLDIEDVSFLTTTNDLMPSAKRDGSMLHYATIFMVAKVKASGGADGVNGKRENTELPDVKVMEPNKCAGWEWVSWEDLERWGNAQILREGDGQRETKEIVGLQNGYGGKDGEDQQQDRQLFTPMVNLLLQRPGIIPSRSKH